MTTDHTKTRKPSYYPSIRELRRLLVAEWELMRADYTREDLTEDDVAGIDVRLQVHDGSWTFHAGDPQYDQDHRGAWGYGFLSWERQNLTNLARDLIDEAFADSTENLPLT